MNTQTIEKLETEVKHITIAIEALKLGMLKQDRDMEKAAEKILERLLGDALRLVTRGQ